MCEMAASATVTAMNMITLPLPFPNTTKFLLLIPSTSTPPFPLSKSKRTTPEQHQFQLKTHSYSYSYSYSYSVSRKREAGIVCGLPLPVDPWAPTIDSQSIASQLFAFSLFPYIAFLYFITKSKTSPNLTLFGFYFLLAFVAATIPAGIYAKVQYGTSLSNVDWLHGGAESLLALTNLFIVLGLRDSLRKAKKSGQNTSTPDSVSKQENK